jgi:hypothetical protein
MVDVPGNVQHEVIGIAPTSSWSNGLLLDFMRIDTLPDQTVWSVPAFQP